jgi:hypothetical protein
VPEFPTIYLTNVNLIQNFVLNIRFEDTFSYYCCIKVSWLGYRLDNRGIVVGFPAGSRNLSLLQSVQNESTWRPPSFLFNGYREHFPWEQYHLGVKLKTAPSSAEVKNKWRYISTAPYAFMACSGATLCVPLPELVVSVILGFCRDVDEICALLGYYAASCGNCLPTLRDNVSVPPEEGRSH